MTKAFKTASMCDPAAAASHNLVGQRLGRKGQETREKILCAMLRLAEDPCGPAVTLTNVAREASVRLTNLYLYFPDLGDLLLAGLARVMETADDAYVGRLRRRWDDDQLQEECLAFLKAHFDFWKCHARLFHMRNALADANDLRVMEYRNVATRPLIDLLIGQMDCAPEEGSGANNFATVLVTALERMATVVTNPNFYLMAGHKAPVNNDAYVDGLLHAEAEIIVFAIRQQRQRNAGMGVAPGAP